MWQHPLRKVIFVGDYIDRGPAIPETLNLVRRMQESGHAIALMGNHEYNALAYAYQLPGGSYLRAHNSVHNHQHHETLSQFAGREAEWQDYLSWFYTLPLFLELPGLRAVHACWDEAHIGWLRDDGYETLTEELLLRSHEKGSYPERVIEDILKGKEYNVPENYAWRDKDGHWRTENRYRWWLDATALRYGEFFFNCPPQLKETKIEEQIEYVVYPKEAKPVFVGHYWLEDPYPVVQAANVVCLDYSIAKGGYLVAYRWNGEATLNNAHFVVVSHTEANR